MRRSGLAGLKLANLYLDQTSRTRYLVHLVRDHDRQRKLQEEPYPNEDKNTSLFRLV